MTITEYQEKVDHWIKTVGVRYFNELTNLGILMEESGELARVMVRKFGEQSSKDSDLSVKLEEEIGDVLFVLTCIANQTGVDLEKVIEERISTENKESYVSSLMQKGINKVAQKVGEEAVELVIESMDNNEKAFLEESADLLFHYLVLLKAKGFSIRDSLAILEKRHQNRT